MAKVMRHTVLLALLVFIYPIAFMSFHVLHDHMPEDSCVHSVCNHKNHCDSTKNEEEDGQTRLSENSDCLICEYEFAKTEVARSATILPVASINSIRYETLLSQKCITFTGTNKLLRAPPFIA